MTNAEDLMKFHAEQLKGMSAAATKTLEGFQKLAELNLATARASFEASGEQIRALLAVKDVKTLTELAASYAKPQPDAFKAYAQAVYAISSQTNADLAKMLEQQFAESQRQLYSAVEELAEKAPAGSEGAVSFIKQVLSASSTAYEQLNKATRQFTDMAESAARGESAKAGSKPVRKKA